MTVDLIIIIIEGSNMGSNRREKQFNYGTGGIGKADSYKFMEMEEIGRLIVINS